MPFKDKEKRKESQKQYMRKKRAKSKAEKEKSKEREIEEHVKSGDLNFGLKPLKEELNEEAFKAENPDSTKRDFILAKIKHDRANKNEDLEVGSEHAEEMRLLTLTPFNMNSRNTCIKFRCLHMRVIPDSERFEIILEVETHNANCVYCQKWFEAYRKEMDIWKGVNLFNTE